jgi:hypothetical protein
MSAAPVQFQAKQDTASPALHIRGLQRLSARRAWLSRLKGKMKLWKDFVPFAFHVDYWDYLGWKDPFVQHTQRQHDYAFLARPLGLYAGVRLGRQGMARWSNRDELRPSTKAVRRAHSRSEDASQWKLHFKPAAGSGSLPTISRRLRLDF